MGQEAECKRAVLKLSGNALCPPEKAGFDEESMAYAASELKSALEVCGQLAVVLGGGNLMRGATVSDSGIRRIRADRCGMLATISNALMFQDHLESAGVSSQILSAIPVQGVVEPFEEKRCIAELQQGRVVLLAAGTGHPFFTTDTAAALRAIQISADIMLKATRVDGVYASDPEKNAGAKLYAQLSYHDVLDDELGVMDLTAVAACMKHRLPVRVFNYSVEGNLRAALRGEPVGTLIEGETNGNG